jgi:hypothetical protein
MKYIKKYQKFFEDGVASANASTTAGAGSVSNAVVGSTPGVPGGSGSGDTSMYLVSKKQPKKGNPSEVSDARFLDDVDDEITRVEEAKEELTKTEKMIEEFEKDFDTILDPKFEISQIKLLRKAFSHFNKKFLKNKIDKITLEDLGGVHGKWRETPKKNQMILNPSIFDFTKEFDNDIGNIPYKEFVIVHEIGHCIDHIEKISYSKKWQSISGWKRCGRNEKVPDGYIRYVEKRPGREKAGPKKSNWVYKEGSHFCRKYSSRNPREDFADSFAFAVFKNYKRFNPSGCKEKLEIVKKVLCEID